MMEEYIRILLEQIRCKKSHKYIESEIRSHIEDQIEENMSRGMDPETAERMAVNSMGDPVMTGTELDMIHRPQMNIKLIVMIAAISIIGVLIHSLMLHDSFLQPETEMISGHYLRDVIIGLCVMTGICFVDYSVIARFSKLIGGAIIALKILLIVKSLIEVNSAVKWIGYGGIWMSWLLFDMIYIPIFGAIVYKNSRQGRKGLIKSFMWMYIPVFLELLSANMTCALIMLISMTAQMYLAIRKGWFGESYKAAIIALVSGDVATPSIAASVVKAFGSVFPTNTFNLYRDIVAGFIANDESNYAYITGMLRTINKAALLFGDSSSELSNSMPAADNQYMLTYINCHYGIMVGIAVCLLIGWSLFYMFRSLIKQNNQLGLIVGTGCLMIFILNLALNILINLGAFPIMECWIPFISAGGSCIVLSYALTGILLSIYRYKNVYPSDVDVKMPKLKLLLEQ